MKTEIELNQKYTRLKLEYEYLKGQGERGFPLGLYRPRAPCPLMHWFPKARNILNHLLYCA